MLVSPTNTGYILEELAAIDLLLSGSFRKQDRLVWLSQVCLPSFTGPYLEQEGIDIGIVTAIAAPAALEIQFFGDGGHAGGQLMPLR